MRSESADWQCFTSSLCQHTLDTLYIPGPNCTTRIPSLHKSCTVHLHYVRLSPVRRSPSCHSLLRHLSATPSSASHSPHISRLDFHLQRLAQAVSGSLLVHLGFARMHLSSSVPTCLLLLLVTLSRPEVETIRALHCAPVFALHIVYAVSSDISCLPAADCLCTS
jgi:hypothetical protein